MIAATGNGKEYQPSTSSSVQLTQACLHFQFTEILLATNNFDESLVIGHGGFGKVYKGNIINGSSVAVAAIKRLDSMSSQGATEFWAEVEMLSKLRHCHLVSLFGYCNHENEMILVYEYMPSGTLEDHLHKLGTPLSWLQRLKICISAARGLDYLHTGTGIDVGVIHRDVKSSNILLHESWAAKISDFGLSKIGPTNQPSTSVNTLVKGTFGYLDPHYYASGRLTRKSDVYAFGVVLFEVLCRKRAVDKSIEEGLATWAQDSIKAGKLKDIVDSDIRGQISTKCLKGFVQIAGRCLLSHPKQRPTMAEVVFSLESALTLQEKINSSLQAGGRTIFGKMLDIFLFASNGENSAHDDSKLSSDVKDNVTGNLYPRGALGEGGSGKVSLGLVDNNTLITSNSDVGIKKYKEEGFQRHAANLTSLRENLYPSRPRPLPVVLPAATGQGLEISGQLVRKDGQIFYSLIFENNTNIPLDGFKIQFHKNTFGLAAGVPLQVPQVQPGTSARTLLPMVLFQNIALGPPKSILHVAVKNNQQPVWYFSDRLSLFVLFMEDGRMERSTFLETWKSLPDSNEVSKEIPGITINNVDATIEQLASSNMFFIAKHKNRNQELLYLSAKMTKGIPFLIELTVVIGVQGLKCAIKSPTPEIGPLFSEALETLLSCMG